MAPKISTGSLKISPEVRLSTHLTGFLEIECSAFIFSPTRKVWTSDSEVLISEAVESLWMWEDIFHLFAIFGKKAKETIKVSHCVCRIWGNAWKWDLIGNFAFSRLDFRFIVVMHLYAIQNRRLDALVQAFSSTRITCDDRRHRALRSAETATRQQWLLLRHCRRRRTAAEGRHSPPVRLHEQPPPIAAASDSWTPHPWGIASRVDRSARTLN